MKLTNLLLTSMLSLACTSVYAGNFVNLTNGNGTNLTTANGGLQTGTTNPLADRFYLETTSATFLPGLDPSNSSGEVVASSINYRSFTGGTTNSNSVLTLLDWRVTENVPLLTGIPQATIYDFVYRDSADNKLVFATRYLNEVDNNQEANYLYRYGFSGYTAAAAWTFSTNDDLRLYQSGLTSDYTYNSSVAYDADTVRQKSDISVSEGNPWTGLFLVKTNAEYYTFGDKAIGFYQAGEEGQSVVGGYIGGFVASSTGPVTPVPEPETYAMMLAGLGMVGWMARRRKSI